jgi:hypothetical protein
MHHFFWIKLYLLIVNSQNSKERYNKKILGERIARLCGGIAIIQAPHIVLVHCSKHFRGINFAMGMSEFEILARS